MTKEEIIDGLYMIKNWKCNGDAKMHEVVTNAIKILEQQTCEDCKYNTKPRHAVCNSCICGDRYVKDEKSKQQTCGDAISRQAVKEFVEYIQTIKDKYNDGDLSINYGTICALVIRGWKILESEDVTKDMLPVNPQTKTGWIPVSERLPKAFEFVNCTCHSLIDDREDWVVETVYVPQPQDSPYSDWGNIPMLNWGHAEVIAWVHRDIPEPYRAEIEPQESEVEE